MSERERWIVYPLLFLALGAALRDKLFDMTTSKRIVCQELRVEEDPGGLASPRPLVIIGRTDGRSSGTPPGGFLYVDGRLEVNGPVVARQYAIPGLPYAPGILGIPLPEILRTLQQSAQAWRENKPTDAPPVDQKPPDKEPAERPSQ